MIILGAFRFPEGDAAAKRVYGFGKYFRDNSYDVKYLSWGREKINKKNKYDDFSYISLDEFNNGKGSVFFRIKQYLLLGSKTLYWLKRENLKDVSVIIAYHGTSIFLLRLWFLCKKNNINLVLDCTEWYESKSLAGGKFGIVALDNTLRMQIINPFIGKIIVISNYLHEYYNKKGNDVYKVPFLVEINNKAVLNLNIENNDIKLLYIGNPGKKDKFDILLNTIKIFNENNSRKVYFDIFGLTKEEYLCNMKNLSGDILDTSYISFKGKIDNKLVSTLYKIYHFSILLRPSERYALAGFPTKLVESFSYATPMIASNVGDIPYYVKSGKTGYLVDSIKKENIMLILNQIILLKNKEYNSMRKESFESAKKNFHYKNEKNLINFIGGK